MTKVTDKRIVPVAEFICDLFGDNYPSYRKQYKKWAKELLKIADKAKGKRNG